MRKYDIESPNENLKELRGKEVTKDVYQKFIESLEMPEDEKKGLKELTPLKYFGYAEKLAKSLNNY